MVTKVTGNSEGLFEATGGIPTAAVRDELERILIHPEFQATDKMRDFLRFVVEETLAGRAHQLKGFTIATAVYGRGADFDAAHDPVVRIQAGRLRRSLERYYLVAGGEDAVHIDIPKGTYVPVFSTDSRALDNGDEVRIGAQMANWPTILVRPFKIMSSAPDLGYLGDGLAVELCLALGRCHDIRVLVPRETLLNNEPISHDARFEICGSVRGDSKHAKIVVQLIDIPTTRLIWMESFELPLNVEDVICFQEEAANTICAHIASYHGVLPQAMSNESVNRPISGLTSYQALLKAYAYDLTMTPESFAAAFDALKAAIIKDPGCGFVHGALAHLYADNIAMEFLDLTATPFDDALHFAQTGVQLEPNNQVNRVALARLKMLNKEVKDAVTEIDLALSLNPGSLYYMDVIGMWLALLGEWERGTALIQKAINLNPFYRVYVHFATWLNQFRLQDYEQAYTETGHLLGSGDFWDPLARAATLGHMDRIDEGRAAVDELVTLKPDIGNRGRTLISHGIVHDDLANRVIAGLRNVGLDIA